MNNTAPRVPHHRFHRSNRASINTTRPARTHRPSRLGKVLKPFTQAYEKWDPRLRGPIFCLLWGLEPVRVGPAREKPERLNEQCGCEADARAPWAYEKWESPSGWVKYLFRGFQRMVLTFAYISTEIRESTFPCVSARNVLFARHQVPEGRSTVTKGLGTVLANRPEARPSRTKRVAVSTFNVLMSTTYSLQCHIYLLAT